MSIHSSIRGYVGPALLAVVVATVAVAMGNFAKPPGGLQVAAATTDFGDPAVATGRREYPREALDSDHARVILQRPAQRIVSQGSSIDEFLYAVVPPERVVAVSAYAYSTRDSNVLPAVNKYHPAVAADLEHVLTLSPDLMIVSSTGRSDASSLARAANLSVFRMFTMFTRLDEVADSIRLTGYLTGNDERARVEEEKFRTTVTQAIALRPAMAAKPRLLAISGHLVYGDETLLNDIIAKLGGINVAAEGGLKGYDQVNSETYLRWNPDWIITNSDEDSAEHVKAQLLTDPAIALTTAAKRGQIAVFNNKIFFPMSPKTAELVTALSRTLYAPQGAR